MATRRTHKLPKAEKKARDLRLLCAACLVVALSTISFVRGSMPFFEAWHAWFAAGARTQGGSRMRSTDGTMVGDRLLSEEEAAERDYYAQVWGARIDRFNEGYPLEGYGRVFAEAAWDYGIDPRFSAAIARVESASGSDCFLPHNAWGWGREEWPDWESAIRGHAKGLSENYGYTLSWAGAAAYNQITTEHWYYSVKGFMEEIWETDEL